MEKTGRNERNGTECKIGMKMKKWKNKELMKNEGEKEIVEKQSLERP